MANSTAKQTEATERRERPLKVHHLRPAPGAKTARTRVGRGEGSKGKTAGRGTKGTKARYQVPARFEGGQMPLHMRLPKLRGFKNPFRTEYQVVNLDRLSELFPDGGEVTVEDLVPRAPSARASWSRSWAAARPRWRCR
jgi:large subunit ribosomal protein L15